jgi:hypothetical protein
MFQLGANRLDTLPKAMCRTLQDTLQDLQLYGNPLPDVASPLNAKGKRVAILLQLLVKVSQQSVNNQ